MKKFTSLVPMLLIAMMALSLTSCDKDDMISYSLEGTWRGDMKQRSTFNGKTYNVSYTELFFETDVFRTATGHGKWIDFYSGAPYDYFASNIKWKVRDRVIYIEFLNGDKTQLEIRNYDLTDNYFWGKVWIQGSDSELEFSLRHVDSPNWNDYEWKGYHHYYLAPGYTMEGEQKPNKAPIAEPVRSLNND